MPSKFATSSKKPTAYTLPKPSEQISLALSSSSVLEPATLPHNQSPVFVEPSICATHDDIVVSAKI